MNTPALSISPSPKLTTLRFEKIRSSTPHHFTSESGGYSLCGHLESAHKQHEATTEPSEMYSWKCIVSAASLHRGLDDEKRQQADYALTCPFTLQKL
jgi:hypothetical protein